MKRKILFAALMAVMGIGQSFAQYTTTDLENAGWTSVTALTDIGDNYYVFVDASGTGNYAMADLKYGRPQYQALANPFLSKSEVWIVEEYSGDAIALKSYTYERYIQSGPNGWDNGFSSSKENGTNFTATLTDGKWTLLSGRCGGRLGPWNDNGKPALDGTNGVEQIASNKGDNAPGFYIYSIARADYEAARAEALDFAGKGWKKVTTAEALDVTDNNFIFIETRTGGSAIRGGLGRPAYAAYNDPLTNKDQLWTLHVKDADNSKYAFECQNDGKFITAGDNGWDDGFGTDLNSDDTNMKLTLVADGHWTIQCRRNAADNYMNLWADGDGYYPAENGHIAGNKGTNMMFPYDIYFMPAAVDAYPQALPATGEMAADTWYYFDNEFAGDYQVTATDLTTIEYVQSGATTAAFTENADGTVTLAADRYYVKSSAANSFTFAATSYSYNIGTPTATPADGSTIKPGQTITVNIPAQTDDPSATPTVDFSGVTFGGVAVTVTTSGTGFTFEVPASVTYGTDYTLEIPAGAVAYTGEASSEAATFTFTTPVIADGWYYMRNTDPNYEYKYIARGGSWSTRAVLSDYGLAVKLTMQSDGLYNIMFFDGKQYMYGGDGAVWTDGGEGSANKFLVTKVEGGYKFLNPDFKYLYVYPNDGQIYKDGEDGTTCVWALETTAEYTSSCYARNAQKQVEAAATAAGLTGITTGAQLEAAFTNSMEITIPTVARQSQINKHAANDGGGTEYPFFEETVSGLADGVYKLTFKGMQRAASYSRVDAAEGARGLIYAYANDAKTQLVSAMEQGAETAYSSNYYSERTGLNYPNNSGSTYNAFDAGLYDNDIYVYVTGGTLKFGMKTPSRCPNNSDVYTVFGDFKLTYFSNSYTYLIGDATADPASGSIIQPEQTITVTIPTQTDAPGVTPTVDFSGVTFGGSAATVTTDGTGFTFTVPADVTPNTFYKLVIPEGAVQYAGEASSAATTLTYGTAVPDGTYLLYNAATNKYLAPQGNDVYVTEAGEPISWVVNNEGNSPILFTETNKYVNGRWWANPSNDARDFVLVVSDEPGLEGFKLKKTNPEDNSNGEYYEYLYISGERVAANGRYQDKENPDNFNNWAYAVWQFIPVYTMGDNETVWDITTEVDDAFVKLDRKFNAAWNAVCFPFSMTQDEVEDYFGAGSVVKLVKTFDATKEHLSFETGDGIVANQPCLLKAANETAKGLVIPGRDIVACAATPTYAGSEVTMTGCYAAQTNVPENGLFVQGGKLVYNEGNGEGASYVYSTRAYIVLNGWTPGPSGIKGLNITGLDDDATGIAVVENGELRILDGQAYDLSGRAVKNPAKGLYIINGKKVFIK